MARQCITKVRVLVTVEEIETGLGVDNQASRLVHKIEYNRDFATGVTNGLYADRVYSESADIVNGAPRSLDLLGVLNSALDGGAVNMVDFVAACCRNDGTAGDIELGGNANAVLAPFKVANDVVKIGPDGFFLWVDPQGRTPVAATGDIWQIASGTGTNNAKTLLLGRSA